MSMTERVRLRNELERARGIVAMTFEEYRGTYEVQDAIGRVYEKSLEELEEPFDIGASWSLTEDLEGEEERLQEDIVDDDDVT